MNLSEISIRRPVFAWMLMFGLIIFGAISFLRLGVSQMPDVDFPIVTASLTLEGAAPEVMETDVVDAVENAMMTVQGVRSVTSDSKYGAANVTAEFDLDRNIDVALQEVQTKLAQIQKNLPKEMDPPTVSKTNPEDQPIMWIAINSTSMTRKDLMAYVRDQLKDQFLTVPGVGDVFLGGYVDPNLRVWISNAKLNEYAFTVGDVISTIRNEHSELPAGRIETDESEFNVRTLGEARTPEEFGDLFISQRGGMPNYAKIRLNQVASVEEGLADVRRISRTNGKTPGVGESAVGLGIRKQRGSNAVEVAKLVKLKLAGLKKNFPAGTDGNVVFDSTKFIEEAVGELNFTLILSALLTALVCWFFLGSWSSTVNVVMAIPTSIVGTFIILYFSGFTLNTFTLLGLSLAIGIVVDDAIMVLENIVRHHEQGLSRYEAAVVGSKEISFAAISATIAIIAIFLPVAFMKGVIGKFFFQFGVTMTAAVALSLLEALTLTPMRCSQFLEISKRTTRIGRLAEKVFDWCELKYKDVLQFILNTSQRKIIVVLLAITFFVASIFSVKFLNKEFVPAEDQSRFLVRLQTPVGSSIQFTDEKFKIAEKILAQHSEIARYFLAVGGFGGGDANTGNIFITLKKPADRPGRVSQSVVMQLIRKELSVIPQVKVFVQDLSMRGFSASRGYPIEFSVRGPDWEKLAEYSASIRKKMEASGLMVDVDTDYQTGMPEIQVVPDRNKASQRGVSIVAIGETINALIGGIIVGRYPKGGHRYDIRLRLLREERLKKEDLQKLYVRNNRGELISLSEVVRISEKPTLQSIFRRDRERAISVYANIKPGQSQQAAIDYSSAAAKEILPLGYRAVFSGSSQTFKESFDSLIFALIMGLVVSYMVLASQFNSFRDPITVLIALPFSLSGAFLALLITNQSINIYSLIGLILLMGIVKKNSILLVDFTNQVRNTKKLSVQQSLLIACPIRLRAILMTSFATIAGAVPPALAIGPGAESRIPMAISVIGGVFVSTLLTLLVVPCIYSFFAKQTAVETSALG